jgi:hypothetical protein
MINCATPDQQLYFRLFAVVSNVICNSSVMMVAVCNHMKPIAYLQQRLSAGLLPHVFKTMTLVGKKGKMHK